MSNATTVSNGWLATTANSTNFTDAGWLDICVVGSSKGYIAPIGGDVERAWNPYLLGTLYFCGLCWCFLGVSIIADIFMLAIEKITSVDRIVTKKDGTKVRVRTWNDTVANLTLMAMGSSAPEILLNVIEITGQGFFNGDLGPSTVVGSAAFNLLIINAFCTFAITAGEIRKVKQVGVYVLSSACSILAYVWLVIMLMAISPDIVETWEAAVTFMGFPLLVVAAYLLDTKKCTACCQSKEAQVHPSTLDSRSIGVIKQIASSVGLDGTTNSAAAREQVSHILREVRKANRSSTQKIAVQIAVQEIAKLKSNKSRAFHRVNSSRNIAGYSELETETVGNEEPQKLATQMLVDLEAEAAGALDDEETGDGAKAGEGKARSGLQRGIMTNFHFSLEEYTVLESTQVVHVLVRRPDTSTGADVRIVSRDGTAVAGDDYESIDEVVHFAEGQESHTVMVKIVQDTVYEDDEFFNLDLFPLEAADQLTDFVRGNEAAEAGSKEADESNTETKKEYKWDSSKDVEPTKPAETESVGESATGTPAKKLKKRSSSQGSPLGSPHASPLSPRFKKPVPVDTATIHIVDDSAPGVLVFDTENYVCCESAKKVTITVKRTKGCKGTITCKVKTMDREAVSPDDFIGISEDEPMELEFKEGELSKTFDIEIIDDQVYEKDESFDVVLFEATGGGALGDTTYENEELAANVVIISDEKERKVVDQMAQLFSVNYGRIRIGGQKYSQQFVDAVFPGGNRDCKAKCHVWVLHIFAFPWRILFAIIPPTDLAGGWITFFLALGGIAGSTMIMADLAGLLGCVWGLPPGFTAISLVAIGTSIPDLFASMNAARADEYADASIGNVMGSNSVNVFMGLGLPWLLASVYWDYFSEGEAIQTWARRYKDLPNPEVQARIQDVLDGVQPHGFFIVPAENLGFSVGVFCSVAVVCLVVFGLRRHFVGGELGGPTASKCVAGWCLILLWAIYVTVSGLQSFGVITLE